MKPQNIKLTYIILFLLICLLPVLGMPFTGNQEKIENKDLAVKPDFITEGGWNKNFLSQYGDYFLDHMAFRQELITVNSIIRGELFGVSGVGGVIKGKDDWLFYKATLNDYIRQDTLTEREIYNIAHNIFLMQQYVENKGKQFIFTVPPNKNTLYGENMPYYYQIKTMEASNLEKLVPLLKEKGVHYVNLLDLFQKQDKILYHKRDSHWTNEGAIMVANALLDSIGKEPEAYQEIPFVIKNDFRGDLDKMLYPSLMQTESEQYYDQSFTFAYVGDVRNTEEIIIQTVNPSRKEDLIMFRDSFGNSLLPFMANAFNHAYFSQITPYHFEDIENYPADVVIVEKVERHLSTLGANPPIMEGSAADLSTYRENKHEKTDKGTRVEITGQGEYWRIEGIIEEEYRKEDAKIFIKIDGVPYECFTVTVSKDNQIIDYGYRLYLSKEISLLEECVIEVMIQNQEKMITMPCIYNKSQF